MSKSEVKYVVVVRSIEEPFFRTQILDYLSDVEDFVVESLKKDNVVDVKIRKEVL